MRRVLSLFALLSSLSVLACGGPQGRGAEAVDEPEPEAPLPAPQAEPRVWGNEPSYRLGWPVRVKVGLLNTGEALVNVPSGELFGVKLVARRGEEVVSCRDLEVEAARGGLFPLASGSSAHRFVSLDRRCDLSQPGAYLFEVTVEVPPCEGSDLSGPQAPISFQVQVQEPAQPLVARLLGEEAFEAGEPIAATLRLSNYGTEPVRLAPGTRLLVQLRAESNGEAVPCEAPERGRGPTRPVELASGASLEVPVALSARCQLTLPGRYVITPQVEVPSAGARTFEGTLESAPLELEVLPGEGPEASTDEAE